jgi:hypothetical protein
MGMWTARTGRIGYGLRVMGYRGDVVWLEIELRQETLNGKAVVPGDAGEYAVQGPDLDGIVRRDDLVMLTILLGGDPNVGAHLPRLVIPERREGRFQVLRVQVPG